MKTALVLGNGRSLLDLPREWLDKYPSYGCNYIGLSGIQPTYFVCADHRNVENFDLIKDTAMNAKVAYFGQALPKKDTPAYWLPNARPLYKDTDAFWREENYGGGTVLYPMLKLAYYEGFDNVLLWGTDFDPEWKHFVDDYPAPGNLDRKMDGIMHHMKVAKFTYELVGKRIINFSYPSVLEFERGIIGEW